MPFRDCVLPTADLRLQQEALLLAYPLQVYSELIPQILKRLILLIGDDPLIYVLLLINQYLLSIRAHGEGRKTQAG